MWFCYFGRWTFRAIKHNWVYINLTILKLYFVWNLYEYLKTNFCQQYNYKRRRENLSAVTIGNLCRRVTERRARRSVNKMCIYYLLFLLFCVCCQADETEKQNSTTTTQTLATATKCKHSVYTNNKKKKIKKQTNEMETSTKYSWRAYFSTRRVHT